jgi:hypothetical protein
MTSAKDILADLLLPAIKQDSFSQAALVLCSYSFEPFKIAMAVVGLQAGLVPLKGGDCQDYRSWRQADKGRKDERTEIAPQDIDRIGSLFDTVREKIRPEFAVSKVGSIFYPN